MFMIIILIYSYVCYRGVEWFNIWFIKINNIKKVQNKGYLETWVQLSWYPYQMDSLNPNNQTIDWIFLCTQIHQDKIRIPRTAGVASWLLHMDLDAGCRLGARWLRRRGGETRGTRGHQNQPNHWCLSSLLALTAL